MANRYWVGGTGTWDATTTHWSATSGGAGGASVPTSADNVIFDQNVNSTVTLTGTLACASLQGNGFYTITGSGNLTISGNYADGFQYSSYTGTFTLAGGAGSTLNTGGGTSPALSITGNYNISVTPPQIQSLSIAAGGTLTNTSNINITSGQINVASTGTFSPGTCTITLTSGNWVPTAGATLNTSNATFVFQYNGNATFNGIGGTYAGIQMKLTGANTLTITGSNTFGSIACTANGSNAQSLKFTAGTTTTFTGAGITTSGYSGTNRLSIQSATAAVHTLSKASGTVTVDSCTITNSTAGGGATYIATGSADGGGNTGWIFAGGGDTLFFGNNF